MKIIVCWCAHACMHAQWVKNMHATCMQQGAPQKMYFWLLDLHETSSIWLYWSPNMKINECWRAYACVHAQRVKTCMQCACKKGSHRKCSSDCWIFLKPSAYEYIDLFRWKLMFVGVHMHACMHSQWKHAYNVHATRGLLNVLLIVGSSWNFQNMIILISWHENYCLLVNTCMRVCTAHENMNAMCM